MSDTLSSGTSIVLQASDKLFLGQYLFGNILGLIFDTVSICFAVQWLRDKHTDRKMFRIAVTILVIISTIHLFCDLADSTYSFAIGFGNLERATAVSGFYGVMMMCTGLTGGCVQALYSWRAYILLQKRLWIAILLGVLIVCSTGSWLFVGSALIGISDDTATARYGWTEGLGYIASTTLDAVIAAFMLYRLTTSSKSAFSQESGYILLKLIRLSITTFLFTSLANITALICYETDSGKPFSSDKALADLAAGGDIVLDPLLPAFYTWTLLFWLYSRDGVNAELRKSRGQATLETVPATNVTLPMKPTRSKGSIDFSYRAHRPALSVEVTTLTYETDADGPTLYLTSRAS